MMCGTVENPFIERRATVAVCQHREKKWILPANMSLFLCVMQHALLNFPKRS